MDNDQKSEDQFTKEEGHALREFFDLLHKIDQRENVIHEIKDSEKKSAKRKSDKPIIS